MDAARDFAFAYLSILFEGAPFILVGALLSGILDIFLPPGLMERVLPKSKLPALLVAGLLGLVFPICECAIVPVIRRLVQKGLPVSCGITYMLAAPVVNPITALSTWHAFQGQEPALMVGCRLVLAYALAVAAGLLASRVPLDRLLNKRTREGLRRALLRTGRAERKGGPAAKPDLDSRLVAAARSALRDFVDVAVYFSIGVVITALFNTGIAPGADGLNRMAGGLVSGPVAMMALAFALSLCSTSDAFIAATLHYFSFAAKLSFLVFGPMMDLKLVFLYQTILRREVIVALAAGLFAAIGLAAVLFAWLHPVAVR
jgi:hypothetical protein